MKYIISNLLAVTVASKAFVGTNIGGW